MTMQCETIREQLLEAARPGAAPSAELEEHLKSCTDCTQKLAALRQTMQAMDAWQAPEPSPYFDTRLQARLRAEDAKPVSSRVLYWLGWRWKPALAAASLALALLTGVKVFYMHFDQTPMIAKGSAVSDLQTLDSNSDVYNDMDLLDDDSDQSN